MLSANASLTMLLMNQVKGMARNKGVNLTPRQERDNAGILGVSILYCVLFWKFQCMHAFAVWC